MDNEKYTEAMQMIEDCEKRSEKLSEWEVGFISSISSQLGSKNYLSDRQLETLDKIWERVT